MITPLNSSHESNLIKVPLKGQLKLFVKTMGDSSKFLGNITVPIEILPTKGYIWLPLLTSLSDNLIKTIEDPVTSPKILLGISNDSALPSIENEEILEEKLVNKELAQKLSETKLQLSEETQSRNTIQSSYFNLLSLHNKLIQNSKTREMSLINLLEQKDVEIQKLKKTLESLNKNDEKVQEIHKVEDCHSQDFEGVIQRLVSELDQTKKLFIDSVKQRNYLCSQMKIADPCLDTSIKCVENGRNVLELKAEIIQYDEENKILRKKLAQSEKNKESLNFQIFELLQTIETEGLDPQIINPIDSLLSQQGLVHIFTKVNHTYSIKEKLVQLKIQDSKLFVAQEKSFVPIEDFLQNLKIDPNFRSEAHSKSFSHTFLQNSSKKLKENSENFLQKSFSDLKPLSKPGQRLLQTKNRETSLDQKILKV